MAAQGGGGFKPPKPPPPRRSATAKRQPVTIRLTRSDEKTCNQDEAEGGTRQIFPRDKREMRDPFVNGARMYTRLRFAPQKIPNATLAEKLDISRDHPTVGGAKMQVADSHTIDQDFARSPSQTM